MSSAASRPPHSASQPATTGLANGSMQSSAPSSAQSSIGSSASTSDSSGLRPPKRPQLMSPPARPKPPKPAPAPEPVVEKKPPEPEKPRVIGPISAPSERMQYRAIGLLQGKYVASEEPFNRGDILLEDGTLIDAVLLGRVTSLIKKHIDLEENHLWVVYPRTLYKEEENEPALHMQIVGVWEPEKLSANSKTSEDGTEEVDPLAPRYLSTEEATEQRDLFSVRGEVAKYSEETGEIVINIVQKSKSEHAKPKRPFKLLISGKLEGRTVGYFWDLKVRRESGQLILEEATQVGVVPPKKKSKDARGRKRPGGKPRSKSSAPKPMPKKKKVEEGEVTATESASVEANAVDAKETESKTVESKTVKPQTEKVESAKVESAKVESEKSDAVAEATKAPTIASVVETEPTGVQPEATEVEKTKTSLPKDASAENVDKETADEESE